MTAPECGKCHGADPNCDVCSPAAFASAVRTMIDKGQFLPPRVGGQEDGGEKYTPAGYRYLYPAFDGGFTVRYTPGRFNGAEPVKVEQIFIREDISVSAEAEAKAEAGDGERPPVAAQATTPHMTQEKFWEGVREATGRNDHLRTTPAIGPATPPVHTAQQTEILRLNGKDFDPEFLAACFDAQALLARATHLEEGWNTALEVAARWSARATQAQNELETRDAELDAYKESHARLLHELSHYKKVVEDIRRINSCTDSSNAARGEIEFLCALALLPPDQGEVK